MTDKDKELIELLKHENQELREKIEKILQDTKRTYIEVIISIMGALESKDEYTRGHSFRVSHYCIETAYELPEDKKLTEKEKELLEFASIIHDVGKIGVQDSVLLKPERLTEEEYKIMQTHTLIIKKILGPLIFLKEAIDIALKHHERIDGKGYPFGLKGEEIPFLSKIICVCDAFDAMTTPRQYRKKPLSLDETFAELRKNVGTQFDGVIVESLIRTIKKIGLLKY
ncbi:MAG TPA: HD-GYP domain-containing protein [bacterium]|nr:HD-GYP domain-containing protein [bacterium]